VTPEDVTRRVASLRDAGRALRELPARSVWESLAGLLDDWRRADSRWHRALVAELPAATGFSAPVVAEGLRLGLEGFRGDAFLAWVERELAPSRASGAHGSVVVTGFPSTTVFLAGSIPMPSLLSLLAPLALRSPVAAKSASRDRVTPRLLAESLRHADPRLGPCLEVFDFGGDEAALSEPLLEADCVVATGSDETVAAIAARVRPPRRMVAYGHRVSAAVLDGGELRGERLRDLAERLALDVAAWDQLGCLSPIAAFVVGDEDRADALAEASAEALRALASTLPRGAVDKAAAARIALERSDAEMRRAAGRRVALYADADAGFTVIREDGPELRACPGHRFLRVVPVSDATAALAALRPFAPHLAAIGLSGFGSESKLLAQRLTELGASRICALGRMQAPPLGWHHDNRGVFEPIARFADLEPLD